MFELWLCRMPLLQEIHENIKRWLGITSLTNFQIYISEVTQSCPTLCDPVDDSLPGSSIHGIFQARILEWVAISFSRRSSWPRDWTQVSWIVGRHFIVWATREDEAKEDQPKGRLYRLNKIKEVNNFMCSGYHTDISSSSFSIRQWTG